MLCFFIFFLSCVCVCVFSIPNYLIKLNAFLKQRQIAVEELLIVAEQMELEENGLEFSGGGAVPLISYSCTSFKRSLSQQAKCLPNHH